MTHIPFTPKPGRVLIRETQGEAQKTAGGIIIPGTNDPDNTGIIMKTGEGAESIVGRKVSYVDEAGRPIRIAGLNYLLMYENDIDGFYDE